MERMADLIVIADGIVQPFFITSVPRLDIVQHPCTALGFCERVAVYEMLNQYIGHSLLGGLVPAICVTELPRKVIR